MPTRIDTALILAAGSGTRLAALGTMIPKGFLRLGDLPIVEESALQLVGQGIERIVLVTGHLSDLYEGLRARYPDLITTVHNEKFASTGSMYSLALARECLPGDFLLLESDIIYENRAIRTLLDHPGDEVVLLAGSSESSDPVHVEAPGGRLVNMSKDRAEVGDVTGELVGLSKISRALYATLIEAMEVELPESMKWHYEQDGFVAVAPQTPITCHVEEDLAFFEIDDENDVEIARKLVYPNIIGRDGERPTGKKSG